MDTMYVWKVQYFSSTVRDMWSLYNCEQGNFEQLLPIQFMAGSCSTRDGCVGSYCLKLPISQPSLIDFTCCMSCAFDVWQAKCLRVGSPWVHLGGRISTPVPVCNCSNNPSSDKARGQSKLLQNHMVFMKSIMWICLFLAIKGSSSAVAFHVLFNGDQQKGQKCLLWWIRLTMQWQIVILLIEIFRNVLNVLKICSTDKHHDLILL